MGGREANLTDTSVDDSVAADVVSREVSALCDTLYGGEWKAGADTTARLESAVGELKEQSGTLDALGCAVLAEINGKGLFENPVNSSRALRYFSRIQLDVLQASARAGNAHSQYQCGVVLCSLAHVVETDPNIVRILRELHTSAAHSREGLARKEAAKSIMAGPLGCVVRGLEPGSASELRRRAVEFFSASTQGSHCAGMHALGLCHRDGNGVDRSNDKCVHWLRLASVNGYVEFRL